MSLFFEQVFSLLTSETGSLTYHLVLAFSIAGALQAAINAWRRTPGSAARRTAFGLGFLLVLRLALFLVSAFAWQGIFNTTVLMPLLDRAITLLSLITIIWLWAFPETSRMADAAALLLGLLTLTMFALGLTWWSAEAQPGAFNGSWPDTIAEIYALNLVVIGLLLLLIRRTAGWGFGLAFLLLVGAGHLSHLLIPLRGSDFPGSLRLAQMAAYPLLLTLPGRLPVSKYVAGPVVSSLYPVTEQGPISNAQVLPSFIALASEDDPEKICQVMTRSVARLMAAEVVALLSPPDEGGYMNVLCAYERKRDKFIDGDTLDNRRIPLVASALRRNRPLRLPRDSTSNDLIALAGILHLDKAGDLLVAPIYANEFPDTHALVLLSPNSERSWSQAEQDFLAEFGVSLAHLLHRNQELNHLRQELIQVRQFLEEANLEAAQAKRDSQALSEQLTLLRQETLQDQQNLESLAAVLGVHDDLQEALNQLQEENEQLRKAATNGSTKQIQQLEEELRLSLQEIALLKADLSQADQKLLVLSASGGISPAFQDQLTSIASVAQELRQPLASVLGYTDVILADPNPDASPQQQKLLKRIRVSTERMSRLVDELARLTGPILDREGEALEPVNIAEAIASAISELRPHLREKEIELLREISPDLPALLVDRDALQQTLHQLLENAIGASPHGGEVLLRTRLERSEGQPDYLLIQVSDHGEGIPPANLPLVFSRLQTETAKFVPGLGLPGANLAVIRSLVEAQGGRIWVDSQPGQGSTFSVLFPVPELHPSPNASGEQQA